MPVKEEAYVPCSSIYCFVIVVYYFILVIALYYENLFILNNKRNGRMWKKPQMMGEKKTFLCKHAQNLKQKA